MNGPKKQAREERSLKIVQKNVLKDKKSVAVPSKSKVKEKPKRSMVLSSRASLKKAPPQDQRLVRAIPRVVLDPEDMKGLTRLEMRSVSSEVQHQYAMYYTKFKEFCLTNSVQWPVPKVEADHVMCDYLDFLFEEGKSPHEGEKTVASLEFHRMDIKGTLLRCKRAMRGWKKQCHLKADFLFLA